MVGAGGPDLAARKLALFWSGAASGLTGWNLPAGPATVRRFVDMSAPRPGPRATLWQFAVLAPAAAGAWRARRSAALAPWLLYLASKAIVTVAFFGYVRQGALVAPVVALLAVLACVLSPAPDEPVRGPRAARLLPLAAALALLAIEVARFVTVAAA